MEGDQQRYAMIYQMNGFNPHPRVEGDLTTYEIIIDDLRFNPHPRVEGDQVSGLYLPAV